MKRREFIAATGNAIAVSAVFWSPAARAQSEASAPARDPESKGPAQGD